MFTQNKYYRWYLKLTSQINRDLNCYTEKHHIVPRSLGGSDDLSNIVKLTAKEHYIAHLLLTKITSGNNKYKMIHAFVMMNQCKDFNQSRFSKLNSSLYESLKKQSIEKKKEFKHSDQAKEQIRSYQIGRSKGLRSDEHKRNISNGLKGKEAWNKGLVGIKSHSDVTKQKMSDAHKGKIKTDETKEKLREAHVGMVNCFDLKEYKKVFISTEEFASEKNRYIGFKSNKYQYLREAII
jgi:hypothetical protein